MSDTSFASATRQTAECYPLMHSRSIAVRSTQRVSLPLAIMRKSILTSSVYGKGYGRNVRSLHFFFLEISLKNHFKMSWKFFCRCLLSTKCGGRGVYGKADSEFRENATDNNIRACAHTVILLVIACLFAYLIFTYTLTLSNLYLHIKILYAK